MYESWESFSATEAQDPTYTGDLPCAGIRRLIIDGEYERAEELRDEFMERRIGIAKHNIYETAAIEALNAGRRASFRTWWLHVPDRSLMPGGRSFKAVLHALCSKGSWVVATMIKFVLLAASKGWLQDVQADLVPFIVHRARPAYSLAMLAGVLENAQRYQQKHARDPSVHARVDRSSVVGTALHAAIIDGRRQLVLLILELAFTHNATPPRRALQIVLRAFRRAGEQEALDSARKLIDDNHPAVGVTAAELEALSFDDQNYIATGPLFLRVPLPQMLRQLKQALFSTTPPHATVIAHFIARYLRVGRYRAIEILRRRAAYCKHDIRPLSLWMTAELKFWMIYGRYDRAIVFYISYFLPLGIPARVEKRHLHIAMDPDKHMRRRPQPHIERLEPMNRARQIWPSTHAQAMLWSAFARQTDDLDTLEWTYQHLLLVVSHIRTLDAELGEKTLGQIMGELAKHVYTGPSGPVDTYDGPGERRDLAADKEWLEDEEGDDLPAPSEDVPFSRDVAPHVNMLQQLGRKEGVLEDDPWPEISDAEDTSTEASEPISSDSNLDLDTSSMRALPPVMMPDAAHFTPFIIRFGLLAGPQRALQVVRDMTERDIAPGVQAWYYVAREYAHRGDITAVQKLITHVERLGPIDWEHQGLPRARSRTRFGPISVSAANEQPQGPVVRFYALLLRMYSQRRMWYDVDQLLDEMVAKGYTPGFQPRLDAWIANARLFYAQRRESTSWVFVIIDTHLTVCAGEAAALASGGAPGHRVRLVVVSSQLHA